MTQFQQLIRETCEHPAGSLARRRNLTKLIIAIKRSQKLWREKTEYYQDALQKTWIFLCQNLCEATTAKQAYNPDLSTITTWLNFYLKKRLLDYRSSKGQPTNNDLVIDRLVAKPDIPPILENTIKWAKQDPTGELKSVCIKGYPNITCQKLILYRLPPETSWKELAQKYEISLSTLSNFYQRECMPRLRNFAKSEGYL